MKKAIEFLRSKNIEVTNEGVITSELPDGEEGISLVDELEEITETENGDDSFCYTIIEDRVTKIDI